METLNQLQHRKYSTLYVVSNFQLALALVRKLCSTYYKSFIEML